jgi:hypothetical protein
MSASRKTPLLFTRSLLLKYRHLNDRRLGQLGLRQVNLLVGFNAPYCRNKIQNPFHVDVLVPFGQFKVLIGVLFVDE